MTSATSGLRVDDLSVEDLQAIIDARLADDAAKATAKVTDDGAIAKKEATEEEQEEEGRRYDHRIHPSFNRAHLSEAPDKGPEEASGP